MALLRIWEVPAGNLMYSLSLSVLVSDVLFFCATLNTVHKLLF